MVVRMRRFRLATTILVLVLASSAAALAGNGFRLYASADQHPRSGAVFSASAHGFAARKALLSLYLDRKPCRSTQTSEAKRVNGRTFKAGQSYFRNTRRPWVSVREHGQFYKSFSTYAGKTAEREYVCAYLTTPDSRGKYTVTAMAASAKYTVTP
jgi:hypothetical protein